MRKYFDHCKRLKLPSYYTVVNDEFDAARPWVWSISSGKEFRRDGSVGERPILFGRFLNRDGDLLARSPISVVSLLESCAMSEEIDQSATLIQRIEDDDERLVQEKVYERKLIEHLYDINLTEYSVCVHMVANRFRFPDARIAFTASSIIARVALNSSEVVYSKISSNYKNFCARIRIEPKSPIAKELRKAVEYRSPGAIFHILCSVMREDSLENLEVFSKSLFEAMQVLGITPKLFVESAVDEARDTVKDILQSKSPTLTKLGTVGFVNLSQMLQDFGTFNLQKMHLPPVLLGDCEIYNLHEAPYNLLASFSLDSAYNELVNGQFKMEAFSDACM